jgi:lipopolysaccharide biosynthesis glycosyltransferase
MIEPIEVVIGYDPREAVAYHVCVQSILSHASCPVRITPLALNTLPGYTETHTDGTNAFIYSRFLVPWMFGWKGHAIFLDGDMIVREDIAELWKLRRPDRACSVVKHDYTTKYPTKYLGNANRDYPRKNWSSVILWNNNFFPNRCLTPEYIEKQTGAHLHRFGWLKDEQIDELPAEWNFLVSEFTRDDMAKLLHFTIGIPAFPEYADQEGGDEWRQELANALQPMSV